MPDLTLIAARDNPANALSPAALSPATALAARRHPRFTGESAAYANAREGLLVEEIGLRRHMEAVAAQRHTLPDGPLIEKDYRFVGPNGDKQELADLFGAHDTLITYFWMFGPERARPCPMRTNLLGPLDANAPDIRHHAALAVLGRSPVERQIAFGVERGWRNRASIRRSATTMRSTAAVSTRKPARKIRSSPSIARMTGAGYAFSGWAK